MSQGFDLFFATTELLQYFTAAGQMVQTAPHTLACAGIGVGWAAGDQFVLSGTTANDGTLTIATIAGDNGSLTVVETIAGHNAEAGVMNQQVSSGWKRADFYSRLIGAYSLSQNGVLYSDWSPDGVTNLVTLTTAINAGTPAAYAQECVAKWVRLRVKNNGTDQTSVAVHIYAKGEI